MILIQMWPKSLKQNISLWISLDCSFLLSKIYFLSSILSIRHHLEQNVTIQFVNVNTSIWSQPWCPIWKEMHDRLNLEQSDYQIPEKVSNLWLPNCNKWEESKIIALYGQHTLQVLLQNPIVVGDGPDILCWKPVSSGMWSTKKPIKC